MAPVVLVACFLLVASRTLGIERGDDLLWYMQPASAVMPSSFFLNHCWSPLYCFWLQVLAVVCPNPVWRYFVSWGVMVAVAALLPALFRLRHAWLYTLALVVFPVLGVSPFLGLFAGTIAVAGMCVVLRKGSSFSEALTACCVTCFVISFCRSEFDALVFLAGGAALLAMVVEARWALKLERRGWPRLTMIAVVVLLCGCMAITEHVALGARTGRAFAQHFNRRAQEQGLISPKAHAWESDYAQKVFGVDTVHDAMTTTASMGEFFHANPRLFLRHVLANVLDPKAFVLIVAAVLLLLWSWFWYGAHGLRPASVFLAVLLLGPLTEMVIIYPRDHYAMIALPSLLVFLVQMLPRRLAEPPLATTVGVGVATMVFFQIGLPSLRHEYPSRAQMYLRQAKCERAIDLAAPQSNRVAFDSAGVQSILLGGQRKMMDQAALPEWTGFKRWAAQTRPAWIAEDWSLPATYGVQSAEFESFVRGELGYTAHACQAQAHLTIYAP